MHKRILSLLFISLLGGGQVHAMTAPETVDLVQQQRVSEAELDALLAPIALYPDSVVTHILIASTYPLQVIDAQRWQQANSQLSDETLSALLEEKSWDPSIKALMPFPDILSRMSNDLNWLETLGDAVLTDEDWVLDRVQALRLQAWQQGNLETNDYQQVSYEDRVIVIEPRQPRVVYVPYYDPLITYGHWHHPIAPVIWPGYANVHLHHGFYWGSRVTIGAGFYFGHIFWPERHIVISHRTVHHYPSVSYRQRYNVREYHRWQHNGANRHARYSHRVAERNPAIVKEHKTVRYQQLPTAHAQRDNAVHQQRIEKKLNQQPHVMPHRREQEKRYTQGNKPERHGQATDRQREHAQLAQRDEAGSERSAQAAQVKPTVQPDRQHYKQEKHENKMNRETAMQRQPTQQRQSHSNNQARSHQRDMASHQDKQRTKQH
ncbi:DUF3300 domain-containing protein [Alteromonas sp. AMM-1]|uniref:DUF3300 domain-containing protein n=1 Tax=Alteromonas sp. AMM-1 TaxID=3394233 RepID=UPI0039A704B6